MLLDTPAPTTWRSQALSQRASSVPASAPPALSHRGAVRVWKVGVSPSLPYHPHLRQGGTQEVLSTSTRRAKGRVSRDLGQRQEPGYILVRSWEPDRTQ